MAVIILGKELIRKAWYKLFIAYTTANHHRIMNDLSTAKEDGLCFYVESLFKKDLITKLEKHILEQEIQEDLRKKQAKLESTYIFVYLFPSYKMQPRIQYLMEKIQKYTVK